MKTTSNKGDTLFKTKVSDKTCFRKDKDKTTNAIPSEKTKYNCRILLQIQSVYFNSKDLLEDIDYYPKVFLHDCRYTFFAINKLIHETLDFSDFEPDS